MSAAAVPPVPKVGTGVICWRDGKVLLGMRCGSHAAGVWAMPGGSVDPGETVLECGAREVTDETGLQVLAIRPLRHWSDDDFPAAGSIPAKHFITVFCEADVADGDAVVVEPDKCERWDWFAPDALPSPLMVGTADAIRFAAGRR